MAAPGPAGHSGQAGHSGPLGAAGPLGPLGPLGSIGRYELIARLGSGGMGEVFLARVRGAGGFEKQVVIKRILPHLASDPGFVQRFIEEGKLVVKLRHAGIAQVLDMGEQDGVFYIAMEHVDGKDLGELLRLSKATGRTMPVSIAVHVLGDLLEALDYAHHATDDGRPLGIIHRDVSPSNVMVSTTGEVKLLDFGIARATERLQASTTGAIRGKYGYMSPQQAAGADLDPRSDLFSVGVVAWELFTGARPFDGASDLLTLDRVRYHDPGSLKALRPDAPDDLDAWVRKMLAKHPDERFGSADEALKALRAHVLRSGEISGTRELGEWAAGVVAALPPGLRAAPTQGLSLDDVLRLGLGSNRSSGPVTVDGSQLVAGAGPSTPAAPAPKPATPSEVAPVVTTEPVTASKRPAFLVPLVTLNLVLIAVVLFLVLREGERPIEPSGVATSPSRAEAADASVASAPDASAARAAPDVVASAPEVVAVVAPDVVASEVVDVVAAVAEARPGSVFGSGLASVGDVVLADEVEVTVRATPANANITIGGFRGGGASRKVTARRGTVLHARVSAPGHEERRDTFVVGEEEVVTIALKPLPVGRVQFRFFPANARVTIDGQVIETGGTQVVDTELPAGAHRLRLIASDGRELLEKAFVVQEEKTTNLGTIDGSDGG